MADIDGTSGNDTLVGTPGDDTIQGFEGADLISGLGGADYILDGDGNDTVYGGDGNDTVSGGAGDDAVFGDGGDDLLFVGSGNDTVHGGSSNDTMWDSLGTDSYFGDDGDDLLILNGLGAPPTGDTFDGGAGFDTLSIQFMDTSFPPKSFTQYDHVTNVEKFQSNAFFSMTIAQIGHFQQIDVPALFIEDSGTVTLTNAPLTISLSEGGNTIDLSAETGGPYRTSFAVFGRAGADWIKGSAIDDFLLGGGANDTIYGGAGRDALDGGSGTNLLVGGSGDDWYYSYDASDTLIEEAGGGTDTVSVTYNYTLPLQFENLILTAELGQYLQGNGNAGNNVITGSRGNDIIHGNAGDDTIEGFSGSDELYGNSGNDVLRAGSGFTLLDGGTGFDHVFGSYFPDIIVLTDEDEIDGGVSPNPDSLRINFSAAQAATVLDLSALWGGATVHYGAQGTITDVERIETYVGSAFDDVLIAGEGLTQGFSSMASGGNDRVVGSAGDDGLTTGAGNDTIEAGSGNDILVGGGGLDHLFGQAGDDLLLVGDDFAAGDEYDGGDGDDLLQVLAGGMSSGMTLDLSGYWATASAVVSGIQIRDIERFDINLGLGDDTVLLGPGSTVGHKLGGGAGNDRLGGSSGADTIQGRAGNDTLHGGLDADALYGGFDFVTDILVGGDGNDVLHGDSGLGDYDLMDGGLGNDTYYVDTGDDLTFEALNGRTDTVIADVPGANAGVYLYANVENLILLGTTTFGVGNELNNELTGNAVTNLLLGGEGNDRINGGAGNDVLFGQNGSDTFVFERGTGGDVIGDFTQGQDKIEIDGIYATFDQMKTHFVQVGNNGAIDLGAGDLIVIHSVTMANLTAADFVLL